MNRVSCHLRVKRSRIAPGPQKKMKKILSAWWNFRSIECRKLFLSVDRLKPLFFSTVKKLLFLKSTPWMTHWDEQIILLSSTKTEWKCTRVAKRSLMKILSAWWNFRSSKGWNMFLSVDRIKSIFWYHLWKKNCFFLKNPPWMNPWDEQKILLP